MPSNSARERHLVRRLHKTRLRVQRPQYQRQPDLDRVVKAARIKPG
jgi:hypothetical protein